MEHPLHGLDVVLVQTRFPENIGMAARACVNMGCGHISLVEPERWLRDKASPLATPKGQALLDGITVHDSLADAVADSALVIGTTARRGGWRQAMLSPERCAAEVAACLRQGGRVSLVFGPEDRGLDNAAITHCHRLVCIPTDPAASSLNLAQAVLIIGYEYYKTTIAPEGRRFITNGGEVASKEKLFKFLDALTGRIRQSPRLKDEEHTRSLLINVSNIFTRANITEQELNSLYGIVNILSDGKKDGK